MESEPTALSDSSFGAAVVDVDVHVSVPPLDELAGHLDPRWRDFVRGRGVTFGDIAEMPAPYLGQSSRDDAGRSLVGPVESGGRMSRLFGASCGVVTLPPIASSMVGNFDLAVALASAVNDWGVASVLASDDRLRGSVQVVLDDVGQAAREIDRMADHPQIVQVQLPLTGDMEYGDPRYLPVFEAVARNNLVVSFHHSSATATLLGNPRTGLEWAMFAAPHAATNQAMSLIANGVFDRLPELRVVFLESGVAWVPWFMGRADAQYRELRLEVPWVKRLPSEHLRDNVRVAAQPIGDVSSDEFVRLVEIADLSRMLLYTSDASRPSQVTDPMEGLPEDLRNAIRFGNALETFPRLNVTTPEVVR